MENEDDDQLILTALNCLYNQRVAQRKYRERNKEKLNEYSKNYYYKLRDDPEKYQEYLDKCNQKYERLRADPIKYQEYLEKAKNRYRNKKQNNE